MVVKSAVVASQRRSVSSYRGYPPSELPARTSATGASTQHLPEDVPFSRLCTFFLPHYLRYFSDACVSRFDRLLWRSRPLGCLSEALYCDNVSIAYVIISSVWRRDLSCKAKRQVSNVCVGTYMFC